MDLREYLFRKKISVTDFAASIDYSRSLISMVIHERKKPGKKLAKIIQNVTNGEVKFNLEKKTNVVKSRKGKVNT